VVYRLLTSESGRQWADTQCRGDAMFVESGVGWERTRFWGQCTGTSSATWCTLDPSVATAHRPTPQRHASEHSLISPRGPTAAEPARPGLGARAHSQEHRAGLSCLEHSCTGRARTSLHSRVLAIATG
jgi:hypothetical protein